MILACIAFGQARAADPDAYMLELPVSLDGAYLGDITASVTMDGRAEIERARLHELLFDRLAADVVGSYDLAGPGPNLVALETLRGRGLDIRYDPAALAIKITADAESRARRRVPIRPDPEADPDSAAAPARLASGVSFNVRPEYVHKDPSGETGWKPTRIDYRGFFALGGFDGHALAFEGRYDEEEDESFQLRDLTLIHDEFEEAIRYQVGSFRPPSVSRFAITDDVVGASVERDYRAIRPFQNLRPRGATSFTLEREALVSVEVNGQVVATERIGPGTFDITDFPLTSGANDVRVYVDDEFGRREVGSFNTYIDASLLPDGLTLFGVSAGLTPETSASSVWELSDKFAFNAFIERGFSDQYTALYSLRTLEDRAELATAQRFGLPRNGGVISVETAASFSPDRKPGYAGGVLYAWRSDASDDLVHQLSLQQTYESAAFGIETAGPVAATERLSSQFAGRYGMTIDDWGWGATVQRQRFGGDITETYGLDANYQYDGLSFGVQLQHVTGDDDDTRLLFSVSRSFGDNRARVRATTDEEYEAAWSRRPGHYIHDWGGQVVAARDEQDESLNARVNYVAPRAEAELDHVTIDNGAGSRSSTRANIGFGIGFADGAPTLGRPFDDAFLIVTAHESLEDRRVRLRRPGADGVEAMTDRFGRTLYPIPSTYRAQNLQIEVDDLPPGYDVAAEIETFPGARAGYAVTIGSAANNTLMGTLLGADGEPLSLRVGRLVRVGGDGEADPVRFFTNRTGRMVAEGLAPGRYEIILLPDGDPVATVDIPDDASGLVRFGTIITGETS
ncbi:hypothetical protein DDZ18_03155 [Marinicauda salina]|uniref:Fimbrial biogenesis outer membrane usher protein n=2 Tax=Marinicauda salina TaxID=2135793 RepID=A0A2U2BX73_9PROT|nr:hypothetical protein DDZ18_03155 [Marinicauda salina]